MSVFQEYDSVIAYNYDILFRKFEIDVARLENEYVLESSLSDIENELFCESETLDITVQGKSDKKKSENGFIRFMTNLGEKISNFITDIIQMVSNMFSKSSHLDIETYLNSSDGSIELEQDIEKVHKQVRDELRKGKKLIKAISNGTKIKESAIEDFVDRASAGIQDHGKTIIKTAGSYHRLKHATGELEFMKQEMKESLEDCKKAFGNPDREMNVQRVYKSMKSWIIEGTNVYKMLGRAVQQEALKQQKEQERKNKKNKGGQ